MLLIRCLEHHDLLNVSTARYFDGLEFIWRVRCLSRQSRLLLKALKSAAAKGTTIVFYYWLPAALFLVIK